jgi:GrpB-like predicted nucleotidyltransferase (UPF0157 family)
MEAEADRRKTLPTRERDPRPEIELIGGREKRWVLIADNDPGWPKRFELERRLIREALGGLAIELEHFGSTEVPGLGAKPIVDVLVTVRDPEDGSRSSPDEIDRLRAARARAGASHVPNAGARCSRSHLARFGS